MNKQHIASCKRLLRQRACTGAAASIRFATTFSPAGTTLREMLEAGKQCGLNPVTVRRQFSQARREDAEVERCTKGMTTKQFIDAVVRTHLGR